jgi:hypothetical protein
MVAAAGFLIQRQELDLLSEALRICRELVLLK